jgi:hypothetical protein
MKLENVSSVYVGKSGICCCGCSGTYWYATEHKDWASKNRGYEVGLHELHDGKVKRVFNKIVKNKDHLEFATKDFASFDTGSTLYIVYFKTE